VEGIRLRIVQPSIEQKTKWQADLRAAHVAGQMAMSAQTAAAPVTHLIWSETAIPFLLPDAARIREAVSKVVPPGGLILSGALRRDTAGGDSQLWNSLFAIDGQGGIAAAYDKRHLVPFGEYVPLRGVIPFEKLAQGRLLTLPGLPPVSALICYEAIFPGRVVDPGAEPSWLLNITNDAWFGTSTGPYQHFASARLRAVEEGLPLVRAANSGISAVIDAYGRVVDRLGLNRVGVIDAGLPRPTEEKTLFGRFGNWTLLILLCGTFSLLFAIRRFH
jgi:apolipoprotein N-acyltransferase